MNVKFSGAKFYGKGYFFFTSFENFADFTNVEFLDDVVFTGVKFSGDYDFEGALYNNEPFKPDEV